MFHLLFQEVCLESSKRQVSKPVKPRTGHSLSVEPEKSVLLDRLDPDLESEDLELDMDAVSKSLRSLFGKTRKLFVSSCTPSMKLSVALPATCKRVRLLLPSSTPEVS